jgi:uncharacterized membrane-anchored protein
MKIKREDAELLVDVIISGGYVNKDNKARILHRWNSHGWIEEPDYLEQAELKEIKFENISELGNCDFSNNEAIKLYEIQYDLSREIIKLYKKAIEQLKNK